MNCAVAFDRATLNELHARFPQRYPALLESVARHPRTGRRSFLFAFPQTPLIAQPGRSFFDDLDAARREVTGFGHVVFLGYELLTNIESIDVPPAPGPLPTGLALPVRAALVLDHETGAIEIKGDRAAAEAIEEDLRLVAARGAFGGAPRGRRRVEALSIEEDDPASYLSAVRRAKEYIVAGDIFQANIAREWRLQIDPRAEPTDVYASLCESNPAPFAGLLRFGDAAIVSSSPERLLLSDGVHLESRPIAGTRPRLGSDGSMIADLIGNDKERAEHIMLVDLVRNDLGRVARYGTVSVDELMGVESYAHVHHIVSNVRCELKAGASVGTALAAVFPGGTITGCPKVRCMEIIGELEGTGRGAYTGSLGYVEANGAFDFNILIRTIVWERGQLRFRAGAGIVADSDPDAELAETRAKALGMLRAIHM